MRKYLIIMMACLAIAAGQAMAESTVIIQHLQEKMRQDVNAFKDIKKQLSGLKGDEQTVLKWQEEVRQAKSGSNEMAYAVEQHNKAQLKLIEQRLAVVLDLQDKAESMHQTSVEFEKAFRKSALYGKDTGEQTQKVYLKHATDVFTGFDSILGMISKSASSQDRDKLNKSHGLIKNQIEIMKRKTHRQLKLKEGDLGVITHSFEVLAITTDQLKEMLALDFKDIEMIGLKNQLNVMNQTVQEVQIEIGGFEGFGLESRKAMDFVSEKVMNTELHDYSSPASSGSLADDIQALKDLGGFE